MSQYQKKKKKKNGDFAISKQKQDKTFPKIIKSDKKGL